MGEFRTMQPVRTYVHVQEWVGSIPTWGNSGRCSRYVHTYMYKNGWVAYPHGGIQDDAAGTYMYIRTCTRMGGWNTHMFILRPKTTCTLDTLLISKSILVNVLKLDMDTSQIYISFELI